MESISSNAKRREDSSSRRKEEGDEKDFEKIPAMTTATARESGSDARPHDCSISDGGGPGEEHPPPPNNSTTTATATAEAEEEATHHGRPCKQQRTTIRQTPSSSFSHGANFHPGDTKTTVEAPSPPNRHQVDGKEDVSHNVLPVKRSRSPASQYDETERSLVGMTFALQSYQQQEGQQLPQGASPQEGSATFSFSPPTGGGLPQKVTLSTLFAMLGDNQESNDDLLACVSVWMSSSFYASHNLIVDRNAWGEIPLHYLVRSEWKNPRLYQVLRVLLDRYPHLVYCQCWRGQTVLDTMATVWTALTGRAASENHHGAHQEEEEEEEDSTDMIPVLRKEDSLLHEDLMQALKTGVATGPATRTTLTPQLQALYDLYHLLLEAGRRAFVTEAAAALLHPFPSGTHGECLEAEAGMPVKAAIKKTTTTTRNPEDRRQRQAVLSDDKSMIPHSFFLLTQRLGQDDHDKNAKGKL